MDRNFKKAIIIAIAAILTLGLFPGCGDDDSNGNGTDGAPASTGPATTVDDNGDRTATAADDDTDTGEVDIRDRRGAQGGD